MKQRYYLQLISGAVMMLILGSAVFAQLPDGIEHTFDKNAVANLKEGIRSENLGLRKSAVYFAGKYEVEEVLLDLMAQLDEEENAGVRILIAHSLYKIADSRGIYRIKELAAYDKDLKVRRMAVALFNEFQMKGGQDYAITK